MQVKTVTEFVREIKNVLESSYRVVHVSGEITGLSRASSGHIYFSLQDADSLVSCALFKMDAFRNPLIKKIKNGDVVTCSGSVGVYQKRGTFQIIVKKIFPQGQGMLKLQFEELKKKLAAEGLFDLSKKMAIPKLPKKIAVITAEQGAALQDFLEVYRRRCLWSDILVVPSLVQGENADKSLIKAINKVEKYSHEVQPIDVLVITRGGGSLEDLWCFNSEKLVRRLYDLELPVISAVGHQVDYTLVDYVSDLRVETPSAAAEVLTTEQLRVKSQLEEAKKSLLQTISQKVRLSENRLIHASPRSLLKRLMDNLLSYSKRLNRLDLSNRLMELTQYHEKQWRLDSCRTNLSGQLSQYLRNYRERLASLSVRLEALSPQNTLNRGYSFIQSPCGKVLSSKKDFKQLGAEDVFNINLKDGKIGARKV